MMGAPAIVEDSSEKKPPRGRPRGYVRQVAELIGATIKTDGGPRARVNAAYRQEWFRVFRHAPEELQLQLHGATFAQIAQGNSWKPGWETMGESIGRALRAGTVTDEEALDIAADARARGMSYGYIAAHFRRLRLGERGGNSISLCKALAATVDRYQARFPGTTATQRLAAVEDLLAIIRQEQTEKAHL
jgi:hypothetical protein